MLTLPELSSCTYYSVLPVVRVVTISCSMSFNQELGRGLVFHYFIGHVCLYFLPFASFRLSNSSIIKFVFFYFIYMCQSFRFLGFNQLLNRITANRIQI